MNDETTAGPEMRRLYDRLCADPERKFSGLHMWWGSDAPVASEERAAAINRWLDTAGSPITAEEFDAGGPPQVDVRDWMEKRQL